MPDEVESKDERLTRKFGEWMEFLKAGVAIQEWPGEERSGRTFL